MGTKLPFRTLSVECFHIMKSVNFKVDPYIQPKNTCDGGIETKYYFIICKH